MRRLTKWTLMILLLVALFLWTQIAKSPTADAPQNSVQLYVFDVGQGDAILIQKGSYQILIDGGPDDKVLAALGKAMPNYDRKIDKMILTHPHADHLTGLNAVLDRYEVGEIVDSGATYDSAGFKEFEQKIKDKKITEKIPAVGDKETIFNDGEIQYLWPGTKYSGQTIDNLNNVSEVARFCFYSHCALLMGDQETDEQSAMFAALESQNIPIQSEVLKVAHHGSTNGTNEITLQKIAPRFAAISVGVNNTYGHPHQGTLDLLTAANIQTFRTDQSGTIEFIISESGVIKK